MSLAPKKRRITMSVDLTTHLLILLVELAGAKSSRMSANGNKPSMRIERAAFEACDQQTIRWSYIGSRWYWRIVCLDEI